MAEQNRRPAKRGIDIISRNESRENSLANGQQVNSTKCTHTQCNAPAHGMHTVRVVVVIFSGK
jgi:hypothetical protein